MYDEITINTANKIKVTLKYLTRKYKDKYHECILNKNGLEKVKKDITMFNLNNIRIDDAKRIVLIKTLRNYSKDLEKDNELDFSRSIVKKYEKMNRAYNIILNSVNGVLKQHSQNFDVKEIDFFDTEILAHELENITFKDEEDIRSYALLKTSLILESYVKESLKAIRKELPVM